MEIDDGLLIRLAGEKAYMRGMHYFLDGTVEALEQRGNRISAQVQGNQLYQVELQLTAQQLDGHCDCPASDGVDFCKHCVAAALAYQAQQSTQETPAEDDELLRIEAYLRQQDRKTLLGYLLKIIDTDDQLRSSWAMKVDAESGKLSKSALKKLITRALPYRDLWGYSEVSRYFSEAESAMEPVLEHLPALTADKAFELLEYAFQRLNQALETIDDSGGYRLTLEGDLEQSLIATFERLDWDNERKARFLLEQLDNGFDVYPDIPSAFLTQDDGGVESKFYRLLDERWQSLTGLSAKQIKDQHWRLYHLLLDKARRDDDLGRELALRSRAAESFHDYADLFSLQLERGALDEAEIWLGKAQRKEEFHERDCVKMEIRLLRARDRSAEALALQWRLFEATKRFDDYEQLQALTSDCGESVEDCYRRAEAILMAFDKKSPAPAYRHPNEPLVSFYLMQKEYAKAAAYAEQHPVAVHQLLELARKLLPTQPDTAFGFYARVIPACIESGNKRSYEKTVSLLRELQQGIQDADQWTLLASLDQLVATLRDEHERKRNLIKLLDRYFP